MKKGWFNGDIGCPRSIWDSFKSPNTWWGTQEENSPNIFDFTFVATHLVKNFFFQSCQKLVKKLSKSCQKLTLLNSTIKRKHDNL